jgi:geranylgeranylglycerol-phosphate geranylgeranyltransferase
MITLLRSIAIYLVSFRPYNLALFVTFPLMCLGPLSLALKGSPPTRALVLNAGLAIAGLFLILIATFMVNDVTDREIDKIAHPERPIPSGRVEARHITYAAFLFYAAALVIGYIISKWVLLVTIIILAISFIHFVYTKRRLHITGSSEIITPLTWASMPAYCFLAVGNFDYRTIILLSLFIYFADVAHDTIGGACDLKGDRMGNVKTFASVLGEISVVYISLILFILSAVAGLLLYFLASLGYVYLIGIISFIGYVLLAYFSALRNPNDQRFMAHVARSHSLVGNYFVAGFSLLFLDNLVTRLL